jgi:hypothetical protein
LAEAASKMLAGAGYSDQEIKQYVAEWTNSANEPEQEEQETQEETEVTDKNDPRYDQLANETRQMRLRLMQQEMQKGVVDAIDTNEEIAKMLFGLDKSRGREHATGAYQAIQDQVRKATLDRLYERRDKSGGQFSEDWIQEEAARAASDVAKSSLHGNRRPRPARPYAGNSHGSGHHRCKAAGSCPRVQEGHGPKHRLHHRPRVQHGRSHPSGPRHSAGGETKA